ncbi:MAG: pectin methylesterase [Clostridia bacterium]|nr:pectin methylesterase [Clostridia bacterium]MBR0216974.1 pectin methylesterase [Clostridia bacterium]
MAGYEISIRPGASITDAVKSIPDDGQDAVLHLSEGVFHEKVEITRPHTTIEGCGAEKTVITWNDRATDILDDGVKRGTFRTATLRTDADYITLRAMTIRNDCGPRDEAGQCIALYADGDFLLCEDCCLVSYQDTLFTAPLPPTEVIKGGFTGPKQFAPRKPQRHVYRRDRISGDIDFIFGGAAAWFEQCDIVSVDGRGCRETPYVGYCTAASTPEGQAFGYVFHQCRFLRENVPDGSVYLGRPWRSFAKTVMIDCFFDRHICCEAFHDWDKEEFHKHGMYAVYPANDFSSSMKYARVLTDAEAAQMTETALLESM